MKRFSMRRDLQVSAIALAAVAALQVATPAFAAPEGGMDAKAKALAQLDADWSAAAAAKDLERVASFYAADAIAYPPNEPAAIGREAAKKVWAAYFAAPEFAISWKTLHAEVSKSGELGFTSGTYEDSFKGADGARVTETGKFLCVWKRQKDGTWKAIHDMWNANAK